MLPDAVIVTCAGDVYPDRARKTMGEAARLKRAFIRAEKENQRRVAAVELLIETGGASPDLPKLNPSIYGKRVLDRWNKLNGYSVSAASLDELRQASLPRGPYRPIGLLLWLRGQAAKRGVRLGWKSLAALGSAASPDQKMEATALIKSARRYASAWPNFVER